MKRMLILITCAACAAMLRAGVMPSADLSGTLVRPQEFAPLPRAADGFWRDSVPDAMRRGYIAYGERYSGKPWQTLPFTLFAEFRTNGNRTRYEKVCFAKRRQLAALVMAETVEGRGRFLGDIINGLGSLCEETWWGIPAHYGKMFPVAETQTVDLFNAETAGLVALARYMLAQQLDSVMPGLCGRIDAEVTRRMLVPALSEDYWWKRAGMNWNPWICSNWLTCILICEKDRTRQLEGVAQIMRAMDAFIAAYPEDGGCDEGAGYWDRAAASLFECMRLLDIATSHRADMLTPKVRAMMTYIYKMYIGNGYCVNFADAHSNRMQAQPDIVLPMALWLDDDVMKGFGAYLAEANAIYDSAAAYGASGNFPALGRELFMLKDIRRMMTLTAAEPAPESVWLPDLQIMTARRGGVYAAMKGGNNDESHNHNDVGNFIVYASGEPLFIDIGVGEYTSKTFSGERYAIWTMQSQYHNLPLINGTAQKDGKEYKAEVVSRGRHSLTLDIAGAYPPPAAVKRWYRTLGIKGNVVEVAEDYELDEYRSPSKIVLMTTGQPALAKPGVLSVGSHRVEYDAESMEPTVEDVSSLMDSLLQGVWGKRMCRIVFTIKSKEKKNKVKYRII